MHKLPFSAAEVISMDSNAEANIHSHICFTTSDFQTANQFFHYLLQYFVMTGHMHRKLGSSCQRVTTINGKSGCLELRSIGAVFKFHRGRQVPDFEVTNHP